jgi:hypothetical protein
MEAVLVPPALVVREEQLQEHQEAIAVLHGLLAVRPHHLVLTQQELDARTQEIKLIHFQIDALAVLVRIILVMGVVVQAVLTAVLCMGKHTCKVALVEEDM